MRWLLLGALLASCGEGGSTFERSCRGEAVTDCLPHEYSIIDEASVTPQDVTVGDPTERLRFTVRMSICPEVAVRHEVAVKLQTITSDGGTGSVLDLIRLADDGVTEGDEVAGDGVIDVEIANPFLGERIPERQDVRLSFQAVTRRDCTRGTCVGGTCRSEPLLIDYRTGPRMEL